MKCKHLKGFYVYGVIFLKHIFAKEDLKEIISFSDGGNNNKLNGRDKSPVIFFFEYSNFNKGHFEFRNIKLTRK